MFGDYKYKGVVKLIMLYLSMFDTIEQKQCFERIYNDNKDIMYNYAYKILKDSSSAEDAVHDSFLSFARNFEKSSEMNRDQIRGYLIITVRNAAFKIYNKHRREVSTEDIYINSTTSDIADHTENREFSRILFDMIKGLDGKYGDVIMLKYYCGLRDREIADTLGISRENVKIRLYRARNMLKNKLKEAGCIE